MSTLLLVTDHRFYKYNNHIYDDYVFDYIFFINYLKIFNNVKVLARVKNINSLPTKLKKSSGNNVDFVEFEDVRTLKFLLCSNHLTSKISKKISNIDAICYRIPSVLAYSYFKNNANLKIPYIFEMIGDPELGFVNADDSFIKKIIKKTYASIASKRTKKIIRGAVGGSYVSFNHLQNKFPAPNGAFTESISSIRLHNNYILNVIENFIEIKELNFIHVGSFVPVKNHVKIIELLNDLGKANINAKATFVGSGQLLNSVKNKAINWGIDDKIDFKGQVTGKDNVIKILDKNNIFIIPSSSEGMPRALIEAMSRGLICFGARRGGIEELLEDDFLFNPDDSNDIFNTITNMLNNIERINESRKKNLEIAKQFEFNILEKKRMQLLINLKNSINE